MAPFNIGILFLTFSILFHSIELSSQAYPVHPPPYGERPPSYEIRNGVVHLTGESVRGQAVVYGGFFLGTWENNHFRPVDPLDENSIILLRNGRFETVSNDYRSYLMTQYGLQSGRINWNLLRAHGRPVGRGADGTGPSGASGSGRH